MRTLKTLTISAIITAGAAYPQGEGDRMTTADLDAFILTYYMHPQPELVPAALAYLNTREDASLRSALIPISIFLSYLYAQTPKLRDDWERLTRDVTNPQLKEALSIAASNSPDALIQLIPESPEKNDARWACFFATGADACLDPIISNLKYMSERRDLNLFSVGSSAKWSLAANMPAHPLVRSRIERALQDLDPVIKAQASDILKMSTEAIRGEAIEIIKANHQAGHW